MTKRELAQKALERVSHYRQTVSPKRRFEQMVGEGIINKQGEVLVTQKEREAGHPLEDVPANGFRAT
jgi:hypothetical protein